MLISQHFLQLEVVRDDSVVDKGNAILSIEMWVRVDVCLVSVRGPPGVSNANEIVVFAFALMAQPLNTVAAIPVTRCKLVDLKLASLVVNGNHAARVVAAGLQDLKTIHADLPGHWIVANVTDDSATFIFLLGFFRLIIQVRHRRHS